MIKDINSYENFRMIINHNFFKKLSELFIPIFKLHDKNYKNIKNGSHPKRDLLNSEKYLKDTLTAGGEILIICERLNQSICFLSGFHSTDKLKKEGIDRRNYIVYHLENYFMRITSCYDRCLLLANTVFLLGNAPRNCKSYIICDNIYVKNTIVAKKLKEIEKFINSYNEERNIITHRGHYECSDLRLIEGISIVIPFLNKSKKSIALKRILKNKTDNLVKKKRMEELKQLNNKLFPLLSSFLDEILKEFETNYNKIKEQEN